MLFLISLLSASLASVNSSPIAPAIVAPAVTIPVAVPALVGFWMQEDQAVIEIAQQDTANVYTGRYAAFRKNLTSPKSKKLLSSSLLKDLRPEGEKLTGKVLDPDSGKEYKVELLATGPGTMEMRVKVMGMVARTITWQRQASASN